LEKGLSRAKFNHSQTGVSMSNDFFDDLPLFEGFSQDQRSLLQEIFTPCDFYVDSMLFAQGDPAEYLYIVVKGEVVVNYKPDDGPPLTVARVHRDGVVGWSAALGSRTYTSGAQSTEYSQLLRVRGYDLRKLCEQQPETGVLLLDRLATVIAERLRNTHEQVVALLELGLRNSVHTTGG
jgi:CRP/FNR family cyclic AMP-dependent transcriptional regulator